MNHSGGATTRAPGATASQWDEAAAALPLIVGEEPDRPADI